MSSGNLILRNDELDRIHIVSVWDGMLKQANCTNNFADTTDFAREIRGIPDNNLGFGDFLAGTDADGNTVFIDNLIDRFIQHVRAAKDGGESRKALGQLSETVEWINVWRFAITSHGIYVEQDSFHGFAGWFVEIGVVEVQGHSMTDEILCPSFKTKLGINLVHRILVQIDS